MIRSVNILLKSIIYLFIIINVIFLLKQLNFA